MSKGRITLLTQSLQQCDDISTIVLRVREQEAAGVAQRQGLRDACNLLHSNLDQAPRFNFSVDLQNSIRAELASKTAEMDNLPKGKGHLRPLDAVMRRNRIDTEAYTAERSKLQEDHRRVNEAAARKMKELEKRLDQASCLDP
jgi:TolA-binding protein